MEYGRRFVIGFLMLFFFTPLPAEDIVTIRDSINRYIDEWLDIYRHLHASPELSYHERETSSYLADHLKRLGFEVEEGFGDYGNKGLASYGIVGIMENGPGPRILVRTDMDALPVTEETGLPYASKVTVTDDSGAEIGVMHACGHDIHMTSFVGVARILAENPDMWSGTLMMIGQPAEEVGSGAKAMLRGGLYEKFGKPDSALAFHLHDSLPAGTVGYTPEYAMANVDSVDITVKGIGGHGALPHKTRDPVVLAARIIMGLQTITSRMLSPLDPAVVTVGSIHGGSKHNIIPDRVKLELTVRTYKPEVREEVLGAIRTICRNTALSHGLPENLLPVVSMAENSVYTPAVYNDPDLADRIGKVFRKRLGESRVFILDPVMPGEDFSQYRLEDNQVPSFLFWVGALNPEEAEAYQEAGKAPPPLHSPMLSPDAEPTLRTAIELMTSAVLELMPR